MTRTLEQGARKSNFEAMNIDRSVVQSYQGLPTRRSLAEHFLSL